MSASVGRNKNLAVETEAESGSIPPDEWRARRLTDDPGILYLLQSRVNAMELAKPGDAWGDPLSSREGRNAPLFEVTSGGVIFTIAPHR